MAIFYVWTCHDLTPSALSVNSGTRYINFQIPLLALTDEKGNLSHQQGWRRFSFVCHNQAAIANTVITQTMSDFDKQ